jgi:acid phosphatase type 7
MTLFGVPAPAALNLRSPSRIAPTWHRRARALVVAALLVGWFVTVPATPPATVAAGDPVIAAAGDIACDPADSNFNGGNGMGGECFEKVVSNLLVGHGFAAVLALGDVQYFCASAVAFGASYDPTWGRVKSITHPAVGNHEYLTNSTGAGLGGATGCDATNTGAAGYFGYFGAAAGAPAQGYYSFDVGTWHLIALNSSCGNAGGCGTTSPQGKWLAADLAAHQHQCVLAYWHIPLFSSGGRANASSQPFWNLLYAAHADVVLNGHDHIYEQFAPQTPSGAANPTNGIRQFTVGTGGANHTSIAMVAANSVVSNTTSFGILKLTLHPGGYDWGFQHATGSFTDTGSAACHNPAPTPTPTATSSGAPTPTGVPTATPTASPAGGSFPAVADSYVDASAPTTNHGTATALRVDASPVVRSYLRFNVTGLTGPVTGATLRIWANSAQSVGFDAFRVADSTWGETTIVDANAPAFGAKLGSSGAVAAGTWTSIDVTLAVTGNGLISFGLSTTSATALSLSAREGLNPPQLVVAGPGLAFAGPRNQPADEAPIPALALLTPLLVPGLIRLRHRAGRV